MISSLISQLSLILQIGEVDLIVNFDVMKSPIRSSKKVVFLNGVSLYLIA
jgi:hypothetical protein